MWDLNMNTKVQTYELFGTKLFVVDDIYKYPDKVARYLFARETGWHKVGEPWSRNGKDFEDRRFFGYDNQAVPLYWFCSNLAGQHLYSEHLLTNVMRWKDNKFNAKYKTHYWWAHIDNGYNGIVYFNHGKDLNGTNIYHPKVLQAKWFIDILEINAKEGYGEHSHPWMEKSKLEVIHHIEPKYNRLVLFDGAKLPHGCAVEDKRYFTKDLHKKTHWENYRVNQVFFLDKTKPLNKCP